MDSFKYSIKDLPTILKQRFKEAGGDVSTARLHHNGDRWAIVGELNACYDLSDMD